MKKDFHPTQKELTATCACGAGFRTTSTAKQINVGICSKCHPFFTGQQKFIDTAGRIDKFQSKYANAGGIIKSTSTVSKKSSKK